ncbi:hypothetical protein Metbo_1469 [Methanobacterium lacus]|uniref:Uncharacterized protein n=1 Tax=Methanobacterium lacus (strain AL-21) TaxID=877455 RepID=F0T8F4_METLA|nr:hypothetical protein Metbo_1469 [Methanobacterium lacus]
MNDIWIIILILEGTIGIILSLFKPNHYYFVTFGLLLFSLGIYGAIKKYWSVFNNRSSPKYLVFNNFLNTTF